MQKRSKEIKKTRKEVMRIWQDKCAICGSYINVTDAHIFGRGAYPELSANVDNRVALCMYHHRRVDDLGSVAKKIAYLLYNVSNVRQLQTQLARLRAGGNPQVVTHIDEGQRRARNDY